MNLREPCMLRHPHPDWAYLTFLESGLGRSDLGEPENRLFKVTSAQSECWKWVAGELAPADWAEVTRYHGFRGSLRSSAQSASRRDASHSLSVVWQSGSAGTGWRCGTVVTAAAAPTVAQAPPSRGRAVLWTVCRRGERSLRIAKAGRSPAAEARQKNSMRACARSAARPRCR